MQSNLNGVSLKSFKNEMSIRAKYYDKEDLKLSFSEHIENLKLCQ